MGLRLFVVFLLFCLRVTFASPKTNAAKEILDIARNPSVYDKDIFPKESGPIRVGVTGLIRSLDVDDVNMRTFVDMTFRMMWRDHRIKHSEPGVPSIRFTDYHYFWTPDPFFKGSMKTTQLKTIYPEAYISFTRRGNATFSTRFHVTSKCSMDLSRFPHDRQRCPIQIASYGFAEEDIVFMYHGDDPIKVKEDVSASNRYQLEKIEIASCKSTTATGSYSCLEIMLILSRNFSTYLLEWYLPCISFVVIAFFSELISVDAFLPRLVLTIAPLLTLTACSLSYTNKTASVPYTTALDLFTGISLLTIFVTSLHVIIGYYYSVKPPAPEDQEAKNDAESGSKMQQLKSKLKEKGDYLARIIIIGFYCIFLFLYFLAYSV